MPTTPDTGQAPRASHAGASRFSDPAAAQRAVELALPMLQASLRDKAVGESGCMHVVVMDPTLQPGDCAFEEAILYEHSLPSREAWDADYSRYARAKASLSWRTGMASAQLVHCSPHRLRSDDTLLGGAAVVDGIVVAVSGANAWYDEAFAGCVAMLLRAVAQGACMRAQPAG
ncbi:hypothetical protein [Cupriavidus taiwanensis]|uniref:Uncharacterized protein n=1 Tax=Cupriavidus taiwanensis TaxID=164546 RepID=A0A375J1U6_9BURK|nr:hypothetical protein [Cupriavidus taiwanensis]SPR99097.1 conserved hypothetical protein [Cupriavidus taiwanensis]